MEKLNLKLGTRRSLLAWAQSSWVAREIEKLNPGVSVELVGIDTRGDQIQHLSLQKVEGKEFFVAELDEALKRKRVDFTVHSLKDLSLERPEEFICGAIPQRANPRDVILFGPQGVKNIYAGKTLKIGTSSPRRLENIPPFLKRALPRAIEGSDSLNRIEFLEIRGNVNTRLSRVHENETAPKYLDGVVLAFAGLIRLWADPAGRAELQRLLQGVRWMILPLQQSPAAAGQGALAVECRREDEKIRKILSPLHDARTAKQVEQERKILEDWGGGCHQRFGATAISYRSEQDALMWIRGVKPNGEFVEELRWNPPSPAHSTGSTEGIRIWDGSLNRAKHLKIEAQAGGGFNESHAVFVAHSRAVHGKWAEELRQARVWVSGVSSWYQLAQQGIWVEGCSESLGFERLLGTLREPVIQLPELNKWSVLTHLDALEDWNSYGMHPIATYQLDLAFDSKVQSELQAAHYVFWSSGSQIDGLKEVLPKNAHHACGSGKTAMHLKKLGIQPEVFPTVEEWRKWVSKVHQ